MKERKEDKSSLLRPKCWRPGKKHGSGEMIPRQVGDQQKGKQGNIWQGPRVRECNGVTDNGFRMVSSQITQTSTKEGKQGETKTRKSILPKAAWQKNGNGKGMKDTTWREQGEQTRTQMGDEKNQESRVQKHPERTTVINEERSEESIGKNQRNK